MATLGSSSASAAIPSLGYLVTEKLVRNNHPLWKAQVLSALKGAQVAHFLNSATEISAKTIAKLDKPTEQVPNPEYISWVMGNPSSSCGAVNICCGLGNNRGDVRIPTTCAGDQHAHGAGHRPEGNLLRC